MLGAFAAALPGPTGQTETRVQREGKVSTDGAIATSAVALLTKEAAAGPIGRFEPVPGFATYNLGVQYYPRFAAAYFDRGPVLYRVGDFDRPFADITPARRATDSKKTRNATPAPRKPLAILPPAAPAPPARPANSGHRCLDALTARAANFSVTTYRLPLAFSAAAVPRPAAVTSDTPQCRRDLLAAVARCS